MNRAVALLALLALAAAAAAEDRDFARQLAKLKEEILLAAPAYKAEKHDPMLKGFFGDLVAALGDRALEPAESLRLAASYAAVLDTLKIRRRADCRARLRSILERAPVPGPRIDAFFREVEAELAAIRDMRERDTRPERLIEQYGDARQVGDTQELFRRERAGGSARKARSGEVTELLTKYNPRKEAPAAAPPPARTAEAALGDQKLVDDLFGK